MVPHSAGDHYLREESNEIYIVAAKHIEKLEFAKTIEAIFALLDLANKCLNDEKPWSLFKDGKNKEGEKVLYTALEILRRTALSLYPFTPTLASSIWYQLGFDDAITDNKGKDGYFKLIAAGQKVRNTGPIFKRIEIETKENAQAAKTN
jgi:methionyl-tRNA synthetase